MKIFRTFLVAGLSVAALSVATPCFAGETENAYMASLVGSWSGRSTINFIARGTQESVLCKMTVKPKGDDKLTLSGACALAGAKLQFKSTMAYSDADKQFQTVIKSNTAYEGEATGQLKGSVLTFLLPVYDEKERKPFVATAVFTPDGDTLTLDFNFAEQASGKRTSEVVVPFKRK